jgi:hypothetical protein
LSPARLPRQAGEPAEKDLREWEYKNAAAAAAPQDLNDWQQRSSIHVFLLLRLCVHPAHTEFLKVV